MHFANENALRAKGPTTTQPRATPWENRPSRTKPKGRDHVCRPFRARSLVNARPRAALVPRLPWAGLFAHRWRSLQMRSKVHDRL